MMDKETWLTAVPSLYVRVYRQESTKLTRQYRSLIICEGISFFRNLYLFHMLFPHYM